MTACFKDFELLVNEISQMKDEQLRLEILIEFGENFESVPEYIAKKPYPAINRVSGCESEAYVFPKIDDSGHIWYYFAVENPQGISAKALARIIQTTLSGLHAKEIVQISNDLAYDIFGRSLSMGKGLGLTGMVKMVKEIATEVIQSDK